MEIEANADNDWASGEGTVDPRAAAIWAQTEANRVKFQAVKLTPEESEAVCSAIPELEKRRLTVASNAEAERIKKLIDTLHGVSKRAF